MIAATAEATLQLAPGLDLPLDFASEGLVVIGVRGSGKSNTEVRFAELLFGAGIPFVAIDPKGDWYGVRMDAAAPGLPVPVFGGLYGDFPLDASLGVTIANLLVDENMSAVVDVSRMTHAARARFLTDFFHQLMERHQLEPHVRTVIFEEAHRYIPQQVKGEQAALKEAASAVLLEGRSFGLGCWACTQRPARLHNDVLEEVDTALLFRIGVTASADLKRCRDWVKHEDLGDEIGASLTKLKAGEAWVLSPVSLGIVGRFQMDRRTTFDSGATPIVGAGAVQRRQATMADIDAGAVKEALADAIEKAKANDPNELRRRAEKAEARVKELEMWEPPPPPPPVMGIAAELGGRLETARAHLVECGGALVAAMATFSDLIDEATDATVVPITKAQAKLSPPVAKPEAPVRKAQPAPRAKPPAARASGPGVSLPGPQKKLLTVLAVYGTLTKRQVALTAGYSMNGGGFNNPLGALRTAGYVTKAEPMEITQAGLEALGPFDPLPTGDALVAHWMAQLPSPCKKILQPMIDDRQRVFTKEELAAQAGYSPEGGGFNNPLGRLRTLGLVTKGPDITLTPDFAEAIR